MIENAYEINRRMVFLFRLLGIGQEGLNIFCGLMDICTAIANETYQSCVQKILISAKTVYDCVLKYAVDLERELNINLATKKIARLFRETEHGENGDFPLYTVCLLWIL